MGTRAAGLPDSSRQAPSAVDRAGEVAAVIDRLYDAFLAGDQAGFDRHLHPHVTTWETHLPGHLRERSELDAYRDQRDSRGARPQLSRLDAEDKRIDVWGDTAVARYVLVAEPLDDAAVQRFRVTDVLRRGGGRWRIVHHHSELVLPQGS